MDQSNKDLITRITCALFYLFKHIRLMIIIMLLSGILFDIIQTEHYQSVYGLTVKAIFQSGETSTYSSLESTVTYMKNMNYIFNSKSVKDYLCEKLDLETVSMHCTISSIHDTNLSNISIRANTKREAYYAIYSILEWYEANRNEYKFNYHIQLQSDPMNVVLLNHNSHQRNFMLGAVASGIVVSGILILMNYFRNTIKTTSDLRNKLSSRLYAKLPKEKKKRGKKTGIMITSLKTSFIYREAIKKLRSRVEESSQQHHYQSIMITGSLENEGKSSVAVNLAIALAQNNHNVLLLDCDFRKPSIDLFFGNTEVTDGLNDYLDHQNKTWNEYITTTRIPHLEVIFSKANIEKAEHYISSPALSQLIEEAKKDYEYIIVDTPPSRYITDAAILNSHIDGCLLVVKQDLASVREINETIDRLKGSKDNLIGCIYNASIFDLTSIKQRSGYGYRQGGRS